MDNDHIYQITKKALDKLKANREQQKLNNEEFRAIYAEYLEAMRGADVVPEVGKVIKLSDHTGRAAHPINKDDR